MTTPVSDNCICFCQADLGDGLPSSPGVPQIPGGGTQACSCSASPCQGPAKAPVCLTYRFKAACAPPGFQIKHRLRAQWEAATFLSALKYLPPHNLFIFHSDETRVRLGAPPPAECTQRPRQPSAPIRHFSCRHQRYIQEDFIDAGRLCLPGTSLLPARAVILSPPQKGLWAVCHGKQATSK